MSKKTQDELFLERIFEDEGEQAYPLVDLPEALNQKLYDIPKRARKAKPSSHWMKLSGIAASCVLALVLSTQGFQYYNERQQALQAKRDLEIALFYLNKANAKASQRVQETLRSNIHNAMVEPVAEEIFQAVSG
jgi:hypothetical protein